MMKKIWDWFVISSKDPQKVSLTAKAFLLSWIPMFMALAPVLGIHTPDLGQVANDVSKLIEMVLTAFALVMGIWGLSRKLTNTITGK